jgi:hypothetical protein
MFCGTEMAEGYDVSIFIPHDCMAKHYMIEDEQRTRKGALRITNEQKIHQAE